MVEKKRKRVEKDIRTARERIKNLSVQAERQTMRIIESHQYALLPRLNSNNEMVSKKSTDEDGNSYYTGRNLGKNTVRQMQHHAHGRLRRKLIERQRKFTNGTTIVHPSEAYTSQCCITMLGRFPIMQCSRRGFQLKHGPFQLPV